MAAGISHWLEAEAMQRGGTESFQRVQVIACSVTFIARETVLRENRVPSHQSLVARGLGQDRGGGD
jgi:hypothetical protein